MIWRPSLRRPRVPSSRRSRLTSCRCRCEHLHRMDAVAARVVLEFDARGENATARGENVTARGENVTARGENVTAQRAPDWSAFHVAGPTIPLATSSPSRRW
jgi:hypothetical protein